MISRNALSVRSPAAGSGFGLIRAFLRKQHIVVWWSELPNGALMYSEDMFEKMYASERPGGSNHCERAHVRAFGSITTDGVFLRYSAKRDGRLLVYEL